MGWLYVESISQSVLTKVTKGSSRDAHLKISTSLKKWHIAFSTLRSIWDGVADITCILWFHCERSRLDNPAKMFFVWIRFHAGVQETFSISTIKINLYAKHCFYVSCSKVPQRYHTTLSNPSMLVAPEKTQVVRPNESSPLSCAIMTMIIIFIFYLPHI